MVPVWYSTTYRFNYDTGAMARSLRTYAPVSYRFRSEEKCWEGVCFVGESVVSGGFKIQTVQT